MTHSNLFLAARMSSYRDVCIAFYDCIQTGSVEEFVNELVTRYNRMVLYPLMEDGMEDENPVIEHHGLDLNPNTSQRLVFQFIFGLQVPNVFCPLYDWLDRYNLPYGNRLRLSVAVKIALAMEKLE